MIRYALGRLLSGLITVWFIATATFAAMHAIPGNPLLTGKTTNPEIRRNLLRHYGLDRPLREQYVIYLNNMARGDFGLSFVEKNRRVNDIIAEHFPVSAELGLLAIAIASLGGVLLGAISALYRDRLPDTAVMLFVVLGISVPSFVFAVCGQLALLKLKAWLGFSLRGARLHRLGIDYPDSQRHWLQRPVVGGMGRSSHEPRAGCRRSMSVRPATRL